MSDDRRTVHRTTADPYRLSPGRKARPAVATSYLFARPLPAIACCPAAAAIRRSQSAPASRRLDAIRASLIPVHGQVNSRGDTIPYFGMADTGNGNAGPARLHCIWLQRFRYQSSSSRWLPIDKRSYRRFRYVTTVSVPMPRSAAIPDVGRPYR